MFTIKNNFLFKDGVQVPYKETPNHGGHYVPAYLILHYTAATTAESSISWFLSPKAQASAHLLIDRSGNVTQFAPFNVVCWHAGVSAWDGINGLNSHSIGIEFVNGGDLRKAAGIYVCPVDNKPVWDYVEAKNKRGLPGVWQKYTEEQTAVGVQVCDAIKSAYQIQEVLGHEDIAPGRKVDPGPAFPWDRYSWGPVNGAAETTSGVNLRKGPGTTFESIKVLAKETHVKKVRSENGWTFVEVSGTTPLLTGWIKSEYIN